MEISALNIEAQTSAPPIQKKETVASFAAGLQVLRSFSSHRPIMNLTHVAEESGLTRAAARRYLLTLCDQGYAHFDGKNYTLTSKVLELGFPISLPWASVMWPRPCCAVCRPI